MIALSPEAEAQLDALIALAYKYHNWYKLGVNDWTPATHTLGVLEIRRWTRTGAGLAE